MKNKTIDDLRIYLSTEEAIIEAKKFFDEYNKKDEDSLSYFESPSFFKNSEVIKQWMINNKKFIISDDDYIYTQALSISQVVNFLPVSEIEFITFTSSILKALNKFVKSDDDIPFANGSVEYGEWRVRWLSGQGYISTLELCKDKIRDNIISSIVD